MIRTEHRCSARIYTHGNTKKRYLEAAFKQQANPLQEKTTTKPETAIECLLFRRYPITPPDDQFTPTESTCDRQRRNPSRYMLILVLQHY